VEVRLHEGLGNQLFQLAFAERLAHALASPTRLGSGSGSAESRVRFEGPVVPIYLLGCSGNKVRKIATILKMTFIFSCPANDS
jgi:hypothetical protein